MRIEALAVRLRPRSPLEAADFGARLCQSAAPDIYRCLGLAAMPLLLIAAASAAVSVWLPVLVLWWAKPWLDRTILFVLSRAAFGQTSAIADLWRAQRRVWWHQLIHTVTLRRLSPWRSLTQPVYQLEGSRLNQAALRARQIRRRSGGPAALVTVAFALAEKCLVLSILSFAVWFAPEGETTNLVDILYGDLSAFLPVAVATAYAVTVVFLEPFYVAAGFAMYLTRRAELEAWDIEQEFRRAFA